MENKREEQPIYLKDLLFAALYKWKAALVLAVILAVLLGGFKGFSSYASMKNEEIQIENSAQQELAQEMYEARKANLQQQINANLANARHQQKYLEESLLMNLDAFNYYEVYLSFFVETDYQIMPGMTYQNPDLTNAIIQAYMEAITNDSNTKIMAEVVGVKPEYFLEVLSGETPYDTRSFSLRVNVPDEATAVKILDCLKQRVQQINQDISQTITPHEAHIKEQHTRQVFSAQIAQIQQDQANKLTMLNDTITSLQQQKNDLLPPKPIVVSGNSIIKDTVIFAVVGCILGVILIVLVAWAGHIFDNKIYSGRLLTDRTGIKVFGGVKADKKRNAVDAFLRAIEGRNQLPAEKQYTMLACSVSTVMGNKGTLLLSGGADIQARTAFAQALGQLNAGITLCDADSLLTDISARQALAQADCVLLMEQCGVSRYADVQQQMDVIAEYGKKLLGCVLIDG